MEIRVGAFRGLITSEGKLRLQARRERGSVLGPNVHYMGDFELFGGRQEGDLAKILTVEGLCEGSERETEEEYGVPMLFNSSHSPCPFYRTVFTHPEEGWQDWAFVIPTPPIIWNASLKPVGKAIDVDPHQLKVLGDLNIVVSGTGKRMWSMAMFCLAVGSSVQEWQVAAEQYLDEFRPQRQSDLPVLDERHDQFLRQERNQCFGEQRIPLARVKYGAGVDEAREYCRITALRLRRNVRKNDRALNRAFACRLPPFWNVP